MNARGTQGLQDSSHYERDPGKRRFLARRIAGQVHAGQYDKSGRPYIEHVERVVERARGTHDDSLDDETVSYLHDVLEDSPLTASELDTMGFPPFIVQAVQLLTRDRDKVQYVDYIDTIARSGNELAIMVKWADLQDHLANSGCPPHLRPRYEQAVAVLTEPVRVVRELREQRAQSSQR